MNLIIRKLTKKKLEKSKGHKLELFLLQMNHILNSDGFWFVHSVVCNLEL